MITINVTLLNQGYVPENFTGCAISETGTIGYLKNGKYHRLDGPAIIYNGIFECSYYIEGKCFKSSKDYWESPLVIKTVLDKINSLNPRGETI